MRGFTKDGWVRVQRTVLRRVVGDRLQALLRGDFYVRNHLGEEDYDPIIKEVAALNVPTLPPSLQNGGISATNGNTSQEQPQSPPEPQQKFSPKLETFIQLIAASIMIDASMRGENAGESDTRFIKKKKKLLAKTLQGPKLGDFQKEMLRFGMIKSGEDFEEEEIVESEESRSSGSESESESDEEFETKMKEQQKKSQPTSLPTPMPPQEEDTGGESSSDDGGELDSTVSDTATSITSLSQDGFSTSATSSKHQKKKEKKRLKKERKKEKKRLRKEKKRREKEDKKRKRKLEKDKMKATKHVTKKRKNNIGSEESALSVADNRLSDTANGIDVDESMNLDTHGATEEAPIYEIATRVDFERYKEDLLSRVPKKVKSRFREGGFSRWGKDWLPVLELGPFDVEPGPVRDMWLEMFDNTQVNGREMTRLVFWYGVKFEDRGQAFSFVPATKLVNYEEGEAKGHCKVPKKIQKKTEKNQKMTKTEEQIKRGLREIAEDMQLDKVDRAAWMMKFKEDYEFVEEEAAREEAELKLKSTCVGKEEDEEQQDVAVPKKRKPGRPKKQESAVMAAATTDKSTKRKPGRPKKVVDVLPPEKSTDVKVKKKLGRPKKSEKEKAEKAATKVAEKAAAAEVKSSAAKKWVVVDEDQESDMGTDGDVDDRDYDFDVGSGDDCDVNVDGNSDSDTETSKKRKVDTSEETSTEKGKPITSERANERRAKAAEYREKRAREKAEAQGLVYTKGRVGRKSKQTMMEEEQMKFTKCEEVFLPKMDRLMEAKDAMNAKAALKILNSITARAEMLTPPFLREYPLGMLMKAVRKAFEGVHPEVKDKCKHLTAEMKRLYNEKEKKIPETFEPVKNKKHEAPLDDEQDSDCSTGSVKSETSASQIEKVVVKSEEIAVRTEKTTTRADKVEFSDSISNRHPEMILPSSIPKRNSEMSLSEPVPRRMAGASSSDCLPDATKSDPLPAPKQKKTFSLKGMFEKPKPTPKLNITAPTTSAVVSCTLSPKPKALPSWVTGPAMKTEDFHEQHAKERSLGLEFLIDSASLMTSSSTKRFDPESVSQSLELAIFAETKLRGRNWQQYWEKVHNVVAMLSPGKNKCNAILQGIISGDYQEPSELVKLSRREIWALQPSKGQY